MRTAPKPKAVAPVASTTPVVASTSIGNAIATALLRSPPFLYNEVPVHQNNSTIQTQRSILWSQKINFLIPTINPKSLLPTNLLREATTFKNSCHPQERVEGERILEGCLCPNIQWEMKIYDTHMWTFLCKMNMWHPPKFVLKTPRIVLKYVKQEELENQFDQKAHTYMHQYEPVPALVTHFQIEIHMYNLTSHGTEAT